MSEEIVNFTFEIDNKPIWMPVGISYFINLSECEQNITLNFQDNKIAFNCPEKSAIIPVLSTQSNLALKYGSSSDFKLSFGDTEKSFKIRFIKMVAILNSVVFFQIKFD